MNVVGGTYVGPDPAYNQGAQWGQGIGEAIQGLAAQDRAKKVKYAQDLVAKADALHERLGPAAFALTTVDGKPAQPGDTNLLIPADMVAANQGLLQAAAAAQKELTGKDYTPWASAYLSGGISAEQMKNIQQIMQPMGKQPAPANPSPAGTAAVGMLGSRMIGAQRPTEVVSTPTQESATVAAPSTPTASASLGNPADLRGYYYIRSGQNVFKFDSADEAATFARANGIATSPQYTDGQTPTQDGFVVRDYRLGITRPSPAIVEEPISPGANVAAIGVQAKSGNELQSLQKMPTESNTMLKQRRDAAYAKYIKQGLPSDVAYNRVMQDYPESVQIKATGTPSDQPQMSPAQLAAYERRTGDWHRPALIGDKEGIVNAKAMEHGGREIVAKLNEQYPVYAGGKSDQLSDDDKARMTEDWRASNQRVQQMYDNQLPPYRREPLTSDPYLQRYIQDSYARRVPGNEYAPGPYDMVAPHSQLYDPRYTRNYQLPANAGGRGQIDPQAYVEQQKAALGAAQAARQQAMSMQQPAAVPLQSPPYVAPLQSAPQPSLQQQPTPPSPPQQSLQQQQVQQQREPLLFPNIPSTAMDKAEYAQNMLQQAKGDAAAGDTKRAKAKLQTAVQAEGKGIRALMNSPEMRQFYSDRIGNYSKWINSLSQTELAAYGLDNVASAKNTQDTLAQRKAEADAQAKYWSDLIGLERDKMKPPSPESAQLQMLWEATKIGIGTVQPKDFIDPKTGKFNDQEFAKSIEASDIAKPAYKNLGFFLGMTDLSKVVEYIKSDPGFFGRLFGVPEYTKGVTEAAKAAPLDSTVQKSADSYYKPTR